MCARPLRVDLRLLALALKHLSQSQSTHRACALQEHQRIPLPNVAPSLDRNRRFLFGRGAGRETPRPTRNDAAARYNCGLPFPSSLPTRWCDGSSPSDAAGVPFDGTPAGRDINMYRSSRWGAPRLRAATPSSRAAVPAFSPCSGHHCNPFPTRSPPVLGRMR